MTIFHVIKFPISDLVTFEELNLLPEYIKRKYAFDVVITNSFATKEHREASLKLLADRIRTELKDFEGEL